MSNLFLRAYSAVAQAIAQNTGVVIKTGAGGYSTDGKIIYVPTIDQNSIGPLIHEVAHIRESNFKLNFSSALEQHLTNLLEDVRIEAWIGNIYPGAKMYLADMVIHLVASGFWEAPKDGNPTQLMQQYMLYRLRADVLSQVGLLEYSNDAEDLLRQKVSLGMFVRLEALMYGVEKTTCTRDVQLLAQSIMTMMEEEAKKEEEERKKQSDPNQPNEEQGDDQQQGQSQASGESEEQGDDQQQQGQNAQAAGMPGNESASDDDGDATEDEQSFLRQVLASGADDGLADLKDALQEASATAVNEGRVDRMGAAFTTKAVDNPVNPPRSGMLDEVQAATNALKVQTHALLQAETTATRRNVMQGTRIDPRKLHRAPTGGAIFVKVKPGKKADTAIMVLVDRSGSMAGQGISLATKAALASSLAFDYQGVETAVMAFPFGNGQNGLLKSFSDRATAQVAKYEAIGADGSTPMAEAMMGAGIELANHRFQRKILLVATDGDPDNIASTKDVINLARRAGMEVLGLGIQLDVSHVFGKEFSTSVNNIDELPNAMISVLRSAVFN